MMERAERILVTACVEPDGGLSRHTLEAFGAGAALAGALGGAPLDCGLVGADTAGAARRLAALGAERILAAEGAHFAQARYATDAAAIEALARSSAATIVLAPATARLSRVMAGVAHRLEGRIDAHASGLGAEQGRPVLARWYYRKRMEARLEREVRPWVISLDPGIAPAWEGPPGDAPVERVAIPPESLATRTEVVGDHAPEGGTETIRPDARLLFVAGAGWTKAQADGRVRLDEAQSTILEFLRVSGASLGGSKSIVDLGSEGHSVLPFMTHLNQIGQTGQTPRHPLGLATCCHGEEPHAVGWRFIGERRAINLDPNCGWAQGKADILYVADAFVVMAKINELMRR